MGAPEPEETPMPQPKKPPADADVAWNEALIEQAWEAFQREAPLLIAEHVGEWVAYHGDKRVGFGPTRAALWEACLAQGLPEGEFWVFNLGPVVGEEVIGACGWRPAAGG
jgi:hypothetical protein